MYTIDTLEKSSEADPKNILWKAFAKTWKYTDFQQMGTDLSSTVCEEQR